MGAGEHHLVESPVAQHGQAVAGADLAVDRWCRRSFAREHRGGGDAGHGDCCGAGRRCAAAHTQAYTRSGRRPRDGRRCLREPKQDEHRSKHDDGGRKDGLDAQQDQRPERRERETAQEPHDAGEAPAGEDLRRVAQRGPPVDTSLGHEHATRDREARHPQDLQPPLEPARQRVPGGAGRGARVLLGQHADLLGICQQLLAQRGHRHQADGAATRERQRGGGDRPPPVRSERHRPAERDHGGDQQRQRSGAGVVGHANGFRRDVAAADLGNSRTQVGGDLARDLGRHAPHGGHQQRAGLFELHDHVAVTAQQHLVRGERRAPQDPDEPLGLEHGLDRRDHDRARRDELRRSAFEHLHGHLLGDHRPSRVGPQPVDGTVGERLGLRQLKLHVAGDEAGKCKRHRRDRQKDAPPAAHRGLAQRPERPRPTRRSSMPGL